MKPKRRSPLYELQNREDKNGICAMCKEYNLLTVDHIFPASLLHVWGLKEYGWEDETNLQLICKKCQMLKGANFDFHNPKTIPLIEKYIEILKQLEDIRHKIDIDNMKKVKDLLEPQ